MSNFVLYDHDEFCEIGSDYFGSKLDMELQDPSQLTQDQRFKQLKASVREIKNSGVCLVPALEQEIQWHVQIEGAVGFDCFLFRKSTGEWTQVASLLPAIYSSADKLKGYLTQLYSHEWLSGGKSVGAVFHVIEGFSMADIPLSEPVSASEAAENLQRQLVVAPEPVLADTTLDPAKTAFRAIIYDGNTREPYAAAASLERKYDGFIGLVQQAAGELPLKMTVELLAGPLSLIANLPSIIPWRAGRSAIVCLCFTPSTTLIVLSPAGDIRVIRVLMSRANVSNIATAIQSAIFNLELEDPRIYLFNPGTAGVNTLPRQIMQALKLAEEPELVTSDSFYICQELKSMRPSLAAVSGSLPVLSEELRASASYKRFAQAPWKNQDFYQPEALAKAFRPTTEELKLFRMTKGAMVGLVAIVVLVLTAIGVSVLGMMMSPAWSHSPAEEAQLKLANAQLTKREQNYQILDKALVDRSRLWSVMEMVEELFPASVEYKVDDVDYKFPVVDSKMPARRVLVIQGQTSPEGVEVLRERLGSRVKVEELMKQVARKSADTSWEPTSKTRTVVSAQFSTSREGLGKSKFSEKFQFELIQQFEATDPASF